MKPKVIIWIVIGVLAVVVGYLVFQPSGGGGGVANVDAAGAQKAIDAGAQVIDVRTAGEYQMGHISGAVNVPVDTIEQAAQSWDREATYVVYCASGSRSATAVQTMQALGFKNIAHLAAGIQAWGGELQTGAGGGQAGSGQPPQGGQSGGQTVETNGKPVFIEFYTDS
jgi:rhodanese-related sulfurtransferase